MPNRTARASRTAKIQIEAHQSHERRIPLLEKIQERFQKTVLVYQTSFSFDNGLISDEDATMLEEVLLDTKVNKGLLLIINSSGGFGLAAERITHVCRTYSPQGFEVLVPNKAKSAATIVRAVSSTA